MPPDTWDLPAIRHAVQRAVDDAAAQTTDPAGFLSKLARELEAVLTSAPLDRAPHVSQIVARALLASVLSEAVPGLFEDKKP